MSWSYSYKGSAAGAVDNVKERFAAMRCPEPENTVRKQVQGQIELLLSVWPENLEVEIAAYGSQYAPNQTTKPDELVNSLSLSVKPVHKT